MTSVIWQPCSFRFSQIAIGCNNLMTTRFMSLAKKYLFVPPPPFPQAIFELSRGEQDLIEDLQLARKVCTFKSLRQREYILSKQIKSKPGRPST